MNIVVIGAGAIGTLLISKLLSGRSSVANFSVKMVTRYTSDDKYSFSLSNHLGGSVSFQTPVANNNDIRLADVIFVCVKSFDVSAVIAKYSPFIKAHCDVVLCHNGMGVIDEIVKLGFPKKQLFTLLTTHGALKATNKHVIHTGFGHSDIGYSYHLNTSSGDTSSNDSSSSDPNSEDNHSSEVPIWLNAISDKFSPLHWQTCMQIKQWWKLAINCVINPLTAINNIPNGDITLAKYRAEITDIASEVSNVALSQGITLPSKKIIETSLNVATNTARNTSSMRADLLHSKPTEINYINGYICKVAKQMNIQVPVNQALVEQVLGSKKEP